MSAAAVLRAKALELELLATGQCTCGTKTPELWHHKVLCTYRGLMWGARQLESTAGALELREAADSTSMESPKCP